MVLLFFSMLGSGSQDLSYSTKRKMSQRQKRTRVHRGTQTEECYFVDPLPDIGEEGDYRELHERLLKAEEVWCKKLSFLVFVHFLKCTRKYFFIRLTFCSNVFISLF